jgi:hypothetical protein
MGHAADSASAACAAPHCRAELLKRWSRVGRLARGSWMTPPPPPPPRFPAIHSRETLVTTAGEPGAEAAGAGAGGSADGDADMTCAAPTELEVCLQVAASDDAVFFTAEDVASASAAYLRAKARAPRWHTDARQAWLSSLYHP